MLKKSASTANGFNFSVLIALVGSLVAVSIYAYLGSFSRYIADDYCETVQFRDASLIGGVVGRYMDGGWRAASRYSNLLFVGLGDKLVPDNAQIVVTGMILIWIGGLVFLFHEARRAAGIHWSARMDAFFGALLAFFSLLLAPSLFQTVYWRSSMMTHFAPLVFGALLFAFLLRQFRLAEMRPPFPLTYPAILFFSFLFAGFSEPPTATALTVLPACLVLLWLGSRDAIRTRRLMLFGSAFIGVALGFMVMVFSPAVTNVINEKKPDLAMVFFTSFEYAYLFMRDSIQGRLLPFALSFLLPFVAAWAWKQIPDSDNGQIDSKRAWLFFFLPLLAWLLIAAGFAPSVFGQSYPVERMRFLGQTLIILTLMVMGLRLGLFLPAFKPNPALGLRLSLLVFAAISFLYPLRAAYNLIQSNLPQYRQRAELWDLRHEYILRKADEGVTDMIVPALSGFNGVKEVDGNPAHWINACVAEYYGITSIEAVSVETDEEYMEILRGD